MGIHAQGEHFHQTFGPLFTGEPRSAGGFRGRHLPAAGPSLPENHRYGRVHVHRHGTAQIPRDHRRAVQAPAFRPGIPPLSASLPCPAGLSEGYGTGRQRSHRLGQKGKAAHRPAAGQGGVLGRGNRAREAVRLARPGVDAQARKRHGP